VGVPSDIHNDRWSFAHGNLYGWLVKTNAVAKSATATAAYGGYVENLIGASPATTNVYGLYIAAQTGGGTINSSIWCAGTGKITSMRRPNTSTAAQRAT